MKLCIATGLSGFLGSHILRLAHDYPELSFVSLDRADKSVFTPSLELLLLDRINIDQDDHILCNKLKSLAVNFSDITFLHLASVSRQNESTPDGIRSIYNYNVAESLRLSAICIDSGVSHILSIGSSWQFASHEESKRFVNHYAISKHCFELGLERLVLDAMVGCSLIYLYDNFGAMDTRNKIVDLVLAALDQSRRLDMSPGKQILDISPVQYQARLILESVLKSENLSVRLGEPNHISRFLICGHRIILEQLVALISRICQLPSPVNFGGRPYRPNEIMDPIYPFPRLFSSTVTLPDLALSLESYISKRGIN